MTRIRSYLFSLACLLALVSAAPMASAQPGMVAAAHPLAAEVGREILEKGGNAIDAAVAVQAALGLVEPQSSGIGGGAFMLYYDAKTGITHAYDGREKAPAADDENLFLDENGKPLPFLKAAIGGRAVGVPGVVSMLELAQKAHGKLPWASLFDSSIKLATDGFKLTPRYVASVKRMSRILSQIPGSRTYFMDDAGQPLPVGYLRKNPAYARTLQMIAKDGAKAFYTGPLAKEIVAAATNPALNPGKMTLKDLSSFHAKERKVLCRPYRDDNVCTMPPPTSGGLTTLEILGLLERFDLSKLPPAGLQMVHLFSDASRLAYADRAAYIGDPAFVHVPVDGLLDRDYLAKRSELINPKMALATVTAGKPKGWEKSASAQGREGQHTTHFTIVDKEGNVVSMTSSVQIPYGSGMMVGGFILNNQLTDFEFVPTRNGLPVANRPGGGKQPRSSMDPVIVFGKDHRPILALGSPGGSRIIGYVAQAIVAYLDSGLSLQQAFSQPHYNTNSNAITLEAGTDITKLQPALEAMGHKVQVRDMNSGLHGIAMHYDGDKVTLEGAADPRREGVALLVP